MLPCESRVCSLKSSGGLQGTAKRWEQVAAYVRTRTVDEVVEMVKHGLKSGKAATRQNGITVAKKRQARETKRLCNPILPEKHPQKLRSNCSRWHVILSDKKLLLDGRLIALLEV